MTMPFVRSIDIALALWCVWLGSWAAAEPPPAKNLQVYHIGNSLTRNIPLERLQELFKSVGGRYEYGTQLGGGMRLNQHLVKRSHGGPPGSGKYNVVQPYGEYDHALRQFKFDALILQPYLEELDAEPKSFKQYPYFHAGAIQSASALIDYASGKTQAGDQRWDRQHANTDHVATDRFFIYATWPRAEAILEQPEVKTYSAYWNARYGGGVQPCRDYFDRLVSGLNARHVDLATPVRMIPAGEVLARLDGMIREERLPGIEAFFERNQAYFIRARGPKAPFNPQTFQRQAGVLNFYADGVHMNDQPHNGDDSGTIGAYTAALTVYSTLSGQSPVGLTAGPYEMFDSELDAALIKSLQQTVWEVVTEHPHTGLAVQG